jgi:hypothetical protein
MGGAVVRAQITIKNLANDETRKTVSDALGAYTAQGLMPGSYEVGAVKYGFRDSRTRLVLETHKQSQADLKLYLAGVNGEDASSSTRLEDGLSIRFSALEARINQLELKVTHCREELLLATIKTDPSLYPRVPEAPAKPDEMKTLAANSAPQYGTPSPRKPRLPKGVAARRRQLSGPFHRRMAYTFQNFRVLSPHLPWIMKLPSPSATSLASMELRATSRCLISSCFTAEVRFDTHYMMEFNQLIDQSICGSTEAFRAGGVQIEQASVGGEFHWNNVRGTILFMDGLFASTILRNDASPCCLGIGQWTRNEAYR